MSRNSGKSPRAPRTNKEDKMPKVLVVYYSRTGNTKKMAECVAQGVRREKAVAIVKHVRRTTPADMLKADAIIMGSPTYYGGAAAPIRDLLDRSVKYHGKLVGKVGGAFTSSGGIAGGNETTLLSILTALLIHGMIIQGRSDDDHLARSRSARRTSGQGRAVLRSDAESPGWQRRWRYANRRDGSRAVPADVFPDAQESTPFPSALVESRRSDVKNTECTIYITTRHGRTWRYHRVKNGWTQTGPTGTVHALSAEQLLSHILPPLAAGNNSHVSVSVEADIIKTEGRTSKMGNSKCKMQISKCRGGTMNAKRLKNKNVRDSR
jgi:NAD(P)H dehydrogenase (quinone)